MASNMYNKFVEQLEAVIRACQQILGRSKYDDFSDLSSRELQRGITLARAAIERSSPKGSAYIRQTEEILASGDPDRIRLPNLMGVIESLLADIRAGYLTNVEEMIHADIFADFLEMAAYLLQEGYKDAAAVISGSSLEAHLRQLCQKNAIPVVTVTSSGTNAKKADAMNSDLSGKGVYGKLDQKSVTAWLDLRNKAAHGHYSEYSKEQVALMLSSVREFMTRVPA